MAFLKDKNTRTLIVIMSVLVLIGVVIARIYYDSVNNAIDPRVAPAREMYKNYNKLVQEGSYHELFKLLKRMEGIYERVPHYQDSYEIGVIKNNRAAAFLTMAMYNDSITFDAILYNRLSSDSLLNLAEEEVNQCIKLYEDWIEKYAGKSETEVEKLVSIDFFDGMGAYPEKDKEKYKESRIKELMDAQVETPRRLSVSYTVLGLIFRNRQQYEDAAECYLKALKLWDQNLDARNNLNVLLNEDKVKRNIIQRILPPERGV